MTRSPNIHDIAIGRRIRTRRLAIGMSQEKLAERLDLTFQQIQKYEKGVNRVGAGRLQLIAKILDVPITFFFAVEPSGRGPAADESVLGAGLEFLQTAGAIRLLRAYSKIKSNSKQAALVRLAEEIATDR